MAKNFNRRPSELLEIADNILAFDIDRAASFKLLEWENKRQRDFARTIGIACALAFAGETLKFPDEEDEWDDTVEVW